FPTRRSSDLAHSILCMIIFVIPQMMHMLFVKYLMGKSASSCLHLRFPHTRLMEKRKQKQILTHMNMKFAWETAPILHMGKGSGKQKQSFINMHNSRLWQFVFQL